MQNLPLQSRNRRSAGYRRLGLLPVLWCAVLGVGQAQTVESTRVEAFEWICEDAEGTALSNHRRQDKAFQSCTNRALAEPGVEFFVRPSAYRIVATAGVADNGGEDPSTGAATLSWTPPTQNTDGTALTDLAGYRIYWGTEPGNYTEAIEVDDSGVTTYVVENLPPADYVFVATAINGSGVESAFSNEAAKTVR